MIPLILASKIGLLASKIAFLASKIVFLASKVDILANFWPPKSNFNFQLRIFVDLGSILKRKTLENINFPCAKINIFTNFRFRPQTQKKHLKTWQKPFQTLLKRGLRLFRRPPNVFQILQDAPRWLQDASKILQDATKTHPRRDLEDPWPAPDAPSLRHIAPNPPKTVFHDPQSLQKIIGHSMSC